MYWGGTDGIVTTFAVVAGFTGAQAGNKPLLSGSFLAVLLFGFANLFADGVSMGLGNFLSIRSNQDVYKLEQEKELKEIKNSPDMEKAETVHILKTYGFSKIQAQKLTEIFSENKKYWTQFMMRDELKMMNPEDENPYWAGFATFTSFIVFGFIPLIPYVLLKDIPMVFQISILFTITALVLLGFLRWNTTKETIQRSIGEVVLIGSIAAIIAYFVGTRFAN